MLFVDSAWVVEVVGCVEPAALTISPNAASILSRRWSLASSFSFKTDKSSRMFSNNSFFAIEMYSFDSD